MLQIAPRPSLKPSVETLRQAQIDLHEASKPFVSLISDIYTLARPYMIVDSDGQVIEHGHHFTPELQTQLDKIRELWKDEQNYILKAYGIEIP